MRCLVSAELLFREGKGEGEEEEEEEEYKDFGGEGFKGVMIWGGGVWIPATL